MLPFWGYLMAYAYEYGYCNELKIPLQFITIKIENILLTTLVLILLITYIIYNFQLMSNFVFSILKGNSLQVFLVINITLFIILVYFQIIMNGDLLS